MYNVVINSCKWQKQQKWIDWLYETILKMIRSYNSKIGLRHDGIRRINCEWFLNGRTRVKRRILWLWMLWKLYNKYISGFYNSTLYIYDDIILSISYLHL